MNIFKNWLGHALESFSSADPFYPARRAIFKKLNSAAFIDQQKENYVLMPLSASLPYLTASPYQSKINISHSKRQISRRENYNHLSEGDILVFINGIWSSKASRFTPGAAPFHLRKITDLPAMEQKKIISSYMMDIGLSTDFFTTLCHMLSQETYVLTVEAYAHLKNSITIQHIITESARQVMPQLLLSLGEGSKMELIEEWYAIGEQERCFINNITYVSLAKGSTLSYYYIPIEHHSFYKVNTFYCSQEAHSVFTDYSFSFGSSWLRRNLTVQMRGSNATTNLYGFYIIDNQEKLDNNIQVVHSHPYSLSRQHYKGVLSGHASASFYGKIYLAPEAQKTNAYQLNNAIVLSDEARHYTRPQLEIYADDVKCSHGATIGQLDPQQLFYLQTRGIEALLAKRMLLEAFGKEIVDLISMGNLHSNVKNRFVEKLAKL